jgi:hypothetical protein
MKTHKHLFPQICEFDNLYRAYRNARRGKREKRQVYDFEFNLESELLRLQNELLSQTYQPGAYTNFRLDDRKRRLISAAPFRDRVVHHALCNLIEPIFERKFIFDSYANRKDKGTHRALDRAQQFARRYRYVLQGDTMARLWRVALQRIMDVPSQCFPSVDHAILRGLLARPIADEETLWLIDQILASGANVHARHYVMQWFPGDDLFALQRPRGLPTPALA